MSKKYSKKYRVPFYHSDAIRQMTLPAILNVALQIAGEQSTLLGRSDSWISEKYNLSFIVTEYSINITRLPYFLEEIIIETEIVSYNKFFCYRDFMFMNAESKEELLRIHSTWVLMDIDSRKVSRVIENITTPFDTKMVSKIERGHKFLSALINPVTHTYRVRFSDIDMNQHVNNTKYYDWAVDLLDFEFLTTYTPKEIYIKYNHEVRPSADSEIISTMEFLNFTSHHRINDGDCEIEIVWQKRPSLLEEENDRT